MMNPMECDAVVLKCKSSVAVLCEKILCANILKFMNDWKQDVSPAEFEFLDTAYNETRGRTAKFRMTPKVHKIPWKLRPTYCVLLWHSFESFEPMG